MSYKKRNEDLDDEVNVFYHIDKTAVLQDARIFNSSPINPRKCRLLLTKIIFLLYTSESFNRQEATDLFFNVIKLFQTKDASLRQMMYLVIKELSNIADDVIMVTQSLIKDIQSKQETIYRANAVRALCLITDPSMIQGIERILKATIIDKIPSVSSSALVSSYQMYDVAKDIVKRWSNEVQEAINIKSSSGSGFASNYFNQSNQANQAIISTSNINQYHAISLLYLIRQHDRMAVSKLIQTYAGTSSAGSGGFFRGGNSNAILKNPAAICMLIRFSRKVIEDDKSSTRRIYEILEGYLKHKSEMVNLEAARAICEIQDIPLKELVPAVTVLQLFLSSPKHILRFAAIRTLNKLSIDKPAAVVQCNLDIENLITDSNRSIATFAITTLLKTGNENSVDRLIKQISGLMSDISDEFKIIVVDAIRSLCLKFPNKQASMLAFLSTILRDEGGYSFKKSVVDAMIAMVKHIPESKETALSYLCEFIEDCEFTKLSVRVLSLLGQEGHKTSTPNKYIRYIYNRVILENATIRAAAVSALAKFGVYCQDPAVKKSVAVLLNRCLDDVDDEVRDRATLYLRMMQNEQVAKKYLTDDATFSLATLERQLVDYVSSQNNTKQFNLDQVPVVSKAQVEDEQHHESSSSLLAKPDSKKETKTKTEQPMSSFDQQAIYAEQLSKMSAFSGFGGLFKSSHTIALTESETEYVVECIKHTFARHIVFQFNCTNTLNDQLLEDVHMVMEPDVEGLVQVVEIPAEKLEYGNTNQIYVAFEQEDPEELAEVSFRNMLQYVVKDCDPTTGEADPEGYEDEYQVEDMEVTRGDYIRPAYISDFTHEFELLVENQVIDTFALDKDKAPTLKAACKWIMDVLSMQALEGTDNPKNNNVHTLLLSGTFLDGSRVLAKCRMTFNASSGVAFELAVRSEDEIVSQHVLLTIS